MGKSQLLLGRPLKSILSIFDGKKLDFNFNHLKSSNITFIDKELEEKIKVFNSFKSYSSFLKSKGILIDQEKRKLFISNEILKISKVKKSKINLKNNC